MPLCEIIHLSFFPFHQRYHASIMMLRRMEYEPATKRQRILTVWNMKWFAWFNVNRDTDFQIQQHQIRTGVDRMECGPSFFMEYSISQYPMVNDRGLIARVSYYDD